MLHASGSARRGGGGHTSAAQSSVWSSEDAPIALDGALRALQHDALSGTVVESLGGESDAELTAAEQYRLVEVREAIRRYEAPPDAPGADPAVDVLRMRTALTSLDVCAYEQRVILGGCFQARRAPVADCCENLELYHEFRPHDAANLVDCLATASTSFWTAPSMWQVVVEFYVTDHRTALADGSFRRAWDMAHLLSILFFVIASSYVNLLHYDWDSGDLVVAFSALYVFWLADVVLSTQLSTCDNDGRSLLHPSAVIRKKWRQLLIDSIALLPVDFIAQRYGLWALFLAFRCVKYIKIFRTMYLFEIVNRSHVTPETLSFFYEQKPVVVGAFWVLTFLHISAVFHALSDVWFNEVRQFPHFMQSFITMTAALLGSPANIVAHNNMDRLLIICAMSITILLEGIVVAKCTSLLFAKSVFDENLRHMRATVSIVGHYRVPNVIQREVLSFQFHELNDNASHAMGDLDLLPEKMRNAVMIYSKMQAVRQVPLFSDTDAECQAELATLLYRLQFEPECDMITFGDIGTEMYIISHGYADIVLSNGAMVATLSRGDFFGEVALFSADGKRMASVRALTYVDTWMLTREAFLKCCALFPAFLEKIKVELVKRKVDIDIFEMQLKMALAQVAEPVAESATPPAPAQFNPSATPPAPAQFKPSVTPPASRDASPTHSAPSRTLSLRSPAQSPSRTNTADQSRSASRADQLTQSADTILNVSDQACPVPSAAQIAMLQLADGGVAIIPSFEISVDAACDDASASASSLTSPVTRRAGAISGSFAVVASASPADDAAARQPKPAPAPAPGPAQPPAASMRKHESMLMHSQRQLRRQQSKVGMSKSGK
jgi:CRP-like cAMP-binding protein